MPKIKKRTKASIAPKPKSNIKFPRVVRQPQAKVVAPSTGRIPNELMGQIFKTTLRAIK